MFCSTANQYSASHTASDLSFLIQGIRSEKNHNREKLSHRQWTLKISAIFPSDLQTDNPGVMPSQDQARSTRMSTSCLLNCWLLPLQLNSYQGEYFFQQSFRHALKNAPDMVQTCCNHAWGHAPCTPSSFNTKIWGASILEIVYFFNHVDHAWMFC